MTRVHTASPWRWVLCYGAWILLSIVAGIAAWYLHTLILYLAALVINNPSLRPTGWSPDSLAGVSKLSVLVLGSLWLLVSMWMEGALRRSVLERHFWPFVARLAGVLVGIWLICYGVLLL